MTKQLTYHVTEDGQLLLDFLLSRVTGHGRNALKSMLARGQISVNGAVSKQWNYALQAGQVVSINKGRIVEPPPLAGVSIMYEDDAIIVVHKAAGVLSVATDGGAGSELTAYRQLNAYVRAFDEAARIWIVHRLDRDTSGVMVFARSERVQQLMQANWNERVRERIYVALVEGRVRQAEGRIESWLKENKAMKMYSSDFPGDGQHAVTNYKVLKASKACSLLEVELETGRKNQIRVHLSELGHPIVGDKRYGASSRMLGRLGLHARTLAFEHPVTGKLLRFQTDIPGSFLKEV